MKSLCSRSMSFQGVVHRGLIGVLFFFFSCIFEIEARPTENIDLIMQQIQAYQKNVNIKSIDQQTEEYIAQIQENGALHGIDYRNNHQTAWKPIEHLDKLKSLVLSYTIEDSNYFGDVEIYNKIVKMLQYWYDSAPVSTNWYMQQIAVPQRMGIILILMRSGLKALPVELEQQLIERMEKTGGRPDQEGSAGTAANKIDIATHWIYRGCLQDDESILSFGVDQAYSPLILTTDEGLQYDFSYQQHGHQLYIGGYGDVLVDGISKIALYMVGTPYALPQEKLELLSEFVLKSYIPTTRGQYFLYNVIGRGLSRENALNNSGSAYLMKQMTILDPTNTESYENASFRLNGKKNSSYGINPENLHFWSSDYMLHQRPKYTFDVRMASVYTSRNENGNGENMKGYFLTDGATDIALNGDEYKDIFPVWDWTRLPGVTNPIVENIPLPRAWQTSGTSQFAGGVSNGKYGISAYKLDDNDFEINTCAKKAWFFFDNEIVCLGAGISSRAIQPINTTVNQCLLNGKVFANIDGKKIEVDGVLQSKNNLSWVLHNGIGYYFPEKGNISISNQIQKGTWQSINTSLSSDTIQKQVFKMWFDHGVSPSDEKYSYIIVPNMSIVEEIKKYNTSDISILSNTDSIQAVAHLKLNLCGVVFYKAGTFSDKEYSIMVDKPCVILLDHNSKEDLKIYLSDPSRQESSIKVELQMHSWKNTKTIECKLPIAPDPYAGASVTYCVNKK